MRNNYNYIAPFYDLLSKAIFGNELLKSQIHFFDQLPKNQTVLIIGGGTGQILPFLIDRSLPKSVDFLELSSSMIKKAERRSSVDYIKYIQKDFQNFDLDKKYDVIMTFFFFDLFPNQKTKTLLQKVPLLLSEGGTWLFTDFVNDGSYSFWKNSLIKAMYLFFRFTTGIEAKELPSFYDYFNEFADKIQYEEFSYFKKMIKAKRICFR